MTTNVNEVFNDIHNGCLITAGSIDHYNSMTIGWGTFGCLWSKKVFIAFVKPCRYTYQFMEENDYFTVSFYDEKYKNELSYFGTKSGRDVDKAKETGFHPVDVKGVSVTFKEANETFLLKKIYAQDLDLDQIPEEIVKRYYLKEEPHRVYVGEVIEK